MNAREAKRMVCRDLGREMLQRAVEGIQVPGMDPNDRDRYAQGFIELTEELLRRGGIQLGGPEIDERQTTVFDFLDEVML